MSRVKRLIGCVSSKRVILKLSEKSVLDCWWYCCGDGEGDGKKIGSRGAGITDRLSRAQEFLKSMFLFDHYPLFNKLGIGHRHVVVVKRQSRERKKKEENGTDKYKYLLAGCATSRSSRSRVF